MDKRKEHQRRLARTRKRRQTLIKKVDEFHKLCDAQVYLIIRKNHRFYIYSSNTMDGEWPPTQKNIVSIYLPAFRATFLIGFSVDIISLAADLYSTYSWGRW